GLMLAEWIVVLCFSFQAEDGIRGFHVTGVQTCALPISLEQIAARLRLGTVPVHRALRELHGWGVAVDDGEGWARRDTASRGAGQIGRASRREREEGVGDGAVRREK